MSKYQEIVKKFKTTKILVFGDVMLDLYIQGDVERISPEAPVPIVLERSREYSLGGAGNVAANIAALGGRVTLMGNVGNDSEEDFVRGLCRRSAIVPRFLHEPKRPTSTKVRTVSGQHLLLRIDREKIGEISKVTEKKAVRLLGNLHGQDLVVISDYAKGFVTEAAIRAIKKRFAGKKIVANIKPMPIAQMGTLAFKGIDIGLFKGINTITMNANEGRFFAGVDTSTDKGAANAARRLSKRLNASVVLTRGSNGLTAYDNKLSKAAHVVNRPLHVFDVTGAGDTVVAVLALMLGAGVPLFKAAEVANHAGGIVVGRRGTAVVQPSDLKPFLD
ncbi:MAG: bifunctional hydroxymethylpyrimidine kinase/phosphomethylpyrimidine kinase [Candidatus Liptonbacteria bacterium]|nr:bifunctional hydroxymethylpyrimidine kinase/phosphomethylpyrimidine kinase [Candidatus Liptonbacteria bacterium]